MEKRKKKTSVAWIGRWLGASLSADAPFPALISALHDEFAACSRRLGTLGLQYAVI